MKRAFLVVAAAWLVAIPVAAFAATRVDAHRAVYGFAVAVYGIGHFVCHQLPERSFHLWNVSLPVCARCTGIYAGAAMTSLGLMCVKPRDWNAKTVFIASSIPTLATLAFEWSTGVTPSNWIRAIAGLPLGAAVAWAIGMVN